jgi:hypothetical protein
MSESLIQRIAAFYFLPECSAGGPLHVVVYDYNLSDEVLDRHLGYAASPEPAKWWHYVEDVVYDDVADDWRRVTQDYTPEVLKAATTILRELRALPESERRGVCAAAFRRSHV